MELIAFDTRYGDLNQTPLRQLSYMMAAAYANGLIDKVGELVITEWSLSALPLSAVQMNTLIVHRTIYRAIMHKTGVAQWMTTIQFREALGELDLTHPGVIASFYVWNDTQWALNFVYDTRAGEIKDDEPKRWERTDDGMSFPLPT